MRCIHTHRVNPCNDAIDLDAADEPGAGGDSHLYILTGIDFDKNPSAELASTIMGDGLRANPDAQMLPILFQNGPISENGTNGVTQEMLLAIVKDRLECFQAGPFACQENEDALAHVNAALEILHARTRARMDRGVEGTHTI